jgi:hypothetical protein
VSDTAGPTATALATGTSGSVPGRGGHRPGPGTEPLRPGRELPPVRAPLLVETTPCARERP